MQGINEVRLVGTISRIYPIHNYNNGNCMVLAEITTNDGQETFTHQVSFINDDAIHFSNTATLNAWIDINAKLRPRPKVQNDPNSGIFFEIRCLRFVYVAETPVQPKESVYPESMDEAKPKQSIVKGFFKKFAPQSNIGSNQDAPKISFVATPDEIAQHNKHPHH